MRKTLATIFSLVMLALSPACSRFTPSIDLAVDYSDELGGMMLLSSLEGECIIHIVSNTSWKAGLRFDTGQVQWFTLEQTSGTGDAWIRCNYQANPDAVDRMVVFHIETASSAREFTITQPSL